LKIIQAHSFKRTVKKMHPNQKRELDKAVKAIVENPEAGQIKKGDLSSLRVYKYKVSGQEYLLGYTYDVGEPLLALIAIGPHENFYRDIKH